MKIRRRLWTIAVSMAFILSACSGSGPTPQISNTSAATPTSAESTQVEQTPAQLTGSSNCAKAAIIPTPTSAAANSAYPTPLSENSAYPAPTLPGYSQPDSSYPAPPASPTPRTGTSVMLVPFRIHKPVLAGTTEITGTGPADIPITLANLSLMGEILGETTIRTDCSYSIQLSKPLEKNTWIGITFSNLKGTKWVPNDFLNPAFRGDGAQQVPQVGFFFDTTTATDGK